MRKRFLTGFIKRSVRSRPTAKGLGLGLHITKELVSRHGGRIWVESEPNKGRRISFHLTGVFFEAFTEVLLESAQLAGHVFVDRRRRASTGARDPAGRGEALQDMVWVSLNQVELAEQTVLLPTSCLQSDTFASTWRKQRISNRVKPWLRASGKNQRLQAKCATPTAGQDPSLDTRSASGLPRQSTLKRASGKLTTGRRERSHNRATNRRRMKRSIRTHKGKRISRRRLGTMKGDRTEPKSARTLTGLRALCFFMERIINRIGFSKGVFMKDKTILIVEDDKDISLALSVAIDLARLYNIDGPRRRIGDPVGGDEETGFDPARIWACRTATALIVMDVVSELKFSARVPIIVVQRATRRSVQGAGALGRAKDYFQKPFDNEALMTAIQREIGEETPLLVEYSYH